MNAQQDIIRLVLLRHGQSIWNKDKHFTGWSDVPLSAKGEQEAERAGRMLKDAGYTFDICYTSELQRAADTLRIVLATMGLEGIVIRKDWRLNERHYGALEGLGRWQAIRQFGIWPVLSTQIRFAASPPALDVSDVRFPGNQARYAGIDKVLLPQAESIEQTVERVRALWQYTILPEMRCGKRVLIVSHKNLLRGLMMLLANLSQKQVMKLSIATAQPLCFELDHQLNLVRYYYVQPGKG
ncbi:2,3-bisphosphoglycerate-dependent phosphoglycerate mutase 1 [Nitrosomonas nitrosa]|uniref:2,3-bisphosphoglycerate-dependent phosphoglycerate mutase n=1 Tax=Nitrosomonas nitrosa TaxID=52442 RepID=A0A8H8Z0N2_9PROT|nr:2,3-bisphosphoglycerate-dependent phosphoglycerate mutase [Nitrosomonas nitrosa]CAE6509205.1 2,3-bisphosphoglycerate-dependent phosphoglycerate mutase 1 [Nitrosomonas nitrosa]